MADATVGESKPGKAKNYTVRKVRKFRRVVGELRNYSTPGRRLAVLHLKRKTYDEHRSVDCWAIEADILDACKLYSCTHVQLEIEDGRRLLIKAAVVGRAGAEQGVTLLTKPPTDPRFPAQRKWLVPSRLFAAYIPPDPERDAALIERMHFKGNKL